MTHNETDKVSTHDNTNMPDYFRSSTNKAADKRANNALTNKIHNEFSYVFSATGCFQGTFSLLVKDGSQLYQAPPRRVTYAQQESLKEKLERLQRH